MKYGDTLPQRSIPEWAAYNVDYNEIKRLIKARTTDAEAQAISIPGREDNSEALKELEDELYVELFEQHQRIDLFVQSKSGEIKRRLNHLHQQTVQLKRQNPCIEHSRISIRRLERYAKLEEAILRAGEEIQSLSRFVGAQRLAFRKLLKKYKRWTGSQTLGQKVEKELLGRPSSFSHQTFEPLLAAWTNALASVRAPFTPEGTWNRAGEGKAEVTALTTPTPERSDGPNGRDTRQTHETPVKLPSSAAQLHDAAEVGTGLDFDAALATVPLGTSAGTAAYWVHPDNLVELHVLLLQQMRLKSRSKPSKPSECPTSSDQSGETSAGSHDDTRSGQIEDDIDHIVLDNIDCFAKRESGVVMSEKSLQNAAASIRYCASCEAIVLVRVSTGYMSPGLRSTSPLFLKAKLKRKHLENLFHPCASGTSHHEPTKEVKHGTSTQQSYSAHDLERVREWFAQHSDVRPLVDMQYRRTRLIGVGNNAAHGFWAALDRDITMKCSRRLGTSSNISSPEIYGNDRTEAVQFPYAVLELRWEEGKGDSLAQALDKSHLVERVRGFSLETHAVAVLYKSIFTPPPFWFTMLGRDIRKVPSATVSPRRRHSVKHSFPGSASTERTSASTNSTAYGRSSDGFSSPAVDTPSTSVADMLESSPLRAPTKGRQYGDHQLRRQINCPSHSQHRGYWNEFDDGDERSDAEAYTILVDPHTSRSLPGAAVMSRLASFITSNLTLSTEKIKQQPQRSSNTTRNSRRPVKSNHTASDPETLSSHVDDDNASTQSAPNTHITYSTFPPWDDFNLQPIQTRDSLLLRLSIASFAFSFTTLFIAATLAFSARRKAHLPADLGILVGIIAAMTSAVTGLALMCSREVSVAWLWGGMILLVFVSVCGISWQLLVVVASV